MKNNIAKNQAQLASLFTEVFEELEEKAIRENWRLDNILLKVGQELAMFEFRTNNTRI